MSEKVSVETIIVVGVTETDGYGHLWVTPKGGGERVKIAEKRSGLHHLFEQDKAVMLKWETYKDQPYVADAKLVEGELPPETEPAILPEHQKKINEVRNEVNPPNPLAVGMMTKEIGDMLRVGWAQSSNPASFLITIYGEEIANELVKWYRSQGLGITRVPYDGKTLPDFNN